MIDFSIESGIDTDENKYKFDILAALVLSRVGHTLG